MKRLVSTILCLTLLSAMFIPITASATLPVKNGRTFYIYSKLDNNKVVDVDNAGKENGTNIQLYGQNGTNAQKFKITRTNGNYYKIEAVCSKKVLDVAGGSKKSGTNVQQYKWNNSNAQKWTFIEAGDGYYYIKSALGTYLDVQGGKASDGTNIQSYKGNKTDSQKWRILPADATYTTKTITVNAKSLDDWCKKVTETERSMTGFGRLITDTSGSTRYTGKVIVDREFMSYKTISTKIPSVKQGPNIKNNYVVAKVKLPTKIKYTLHKCKLKNKVDSRFIGNLLSGLVNQQFVWTQSCDCGYTNKLVLDIPLPDPEDIKKDKVYTATTIVEETYMK